MGSKCHILWCIGTSFHLPTNNHENLIGLINSNYVQKKKVAVLGYPPYFKHLPMKWISLIVYDSGDLWESRCLMPWEWQQTCRCTCYWKMGHGKPPLKVQQNNQWRWTNLLPGGSTYCSFCPFGHCKICPFCCFFSESSMCATNPHPTRTWNLSSAIHKQCNNLITEGGYSQTCTPPSSLCVQNILKN